MGGMDKGSQVNDLLKILPSKTKYVFLTPGSGSDRILSERLKVESYKVKDLRSAVEKSLGLASRGASRGDIILFSPGFASFNMFKNEYDRGGQFMEIVKNLK